MDRVKIKKQAREMIQGNLWTILRPLVIISLITAIAGYITGIIFGAESAASELITSLINIAVLPLSYGYTVYILKFVRKEELDTNEIFNHYSKFIPIFLLNFLIGLFTSLWTLLLIVPGIIAALSYQQAIYIMIDENQDAMECIRKSKKMMYGYKSDFFVFLLSFMGWFLLSILTLGLGLIYVIPYVTVAETIYYDELKKITANQ